MSMHDDCIHYVQNLSLRYLNQIRTFLRCIPKKLQDECFTPSVRHGGGESEDKTLFCTNPPDYARLVLTKHQFASIVKTEAPVMLLVVRPVEML